MPKKIFQPMDVVELADGKYTIDVPVFNKIEKPEKEEIEIDNSRMEALEKEIEEHRISWELKKEEMCKQAEEEAEIILEEAQNKSREIMDAQLSEVEAIKQQAEADAEDIRKRATAESERIIADSEKSRDRVFAEARKEATDVGREAGWKEGMEEASRLIDRLHTVLDEAISKRQEIIDGAEMQLVNMVLMVTRKIVKVISEKNKSVVVNNIVQALRKLKNRGEVAIRVNLSDLELASSHIDEFIQMVEGVKSIKVLEDSSVDKGGAIIETDFGEVDARVSSQLKAMEEQIIKLAPIRKYGET